MVPSHLEPSTSAFANVKKVLCRFLTTLFLGYLLRRGNWPENPLQMELLMEK